MINIQYFRTAQDIKDAYGDNVPSNVVCVAGNNDSVLINTSNNNPHSDKEEQDKPTIVNKINNQDITVDPAKNTLILNHNYGYTGLGTVTVNAVTSSIDLNITSENIKQGVSILGVEGILKEEKPDYRYMNGNADRVGLKAIGWTDVDILTYEQNTPPHYSWQNDQFKVSDENKSLYSLEDLNPSSYKDNPNITFVPKKNMESYFAKPFGFIEMKYIKGIPFFDTSNVTDMSYMFSECRSITSVPQLNTSKATNMSGMFQQCVSLTTIPQLDTSNVTNMSYMFNECHSITSVPQLNTSNVTNMTDMFYNCNSLTTIPQLDTSNVTNMSYMFSNCNKLTSVPQLNTSNVTDMKNMFSQCHSITSVPQLNTSNVTDMSYMFNNCKNLTTVSQLDTSNVTNMSYMFSNCNKLTSIPELNTSNVTDMSNMFGECHSITSVPQLNTSNVTNMSNMFNNCKNLATVPQLNTSNVNEMTEMFGNCENLTTVEGIDFSGLTSDLNNLFGWTLNMPKLTRFIVNGKINVSIADDYSIKALTAIDYDSVKSILAAANLTDNTNSKTLTFNRTMTDQNGELAALVTSCTSKGWTITGLTIV